MNILREYGIGDNKKLRYNILNAQGGNTISAMIGQRVEVQAYILIEETGWNTGVVVKTFKVLTTDGEYLGTRSGSFINGWENYLDCMESNELTKFEVGQGTSKAGRHYATFVAVLDE